MQQDSDMGYYREVDSESSTHRLLESNQENEIYTEDGTVYYLNNPANKRETGSWKACSFILGNVCCERLAFYGMSANLIRYFKYDLNEHSATASRNLSTWTGTCYLTPLIGAFVADTYIGRFWTITTFSIIYAIGMGMLTLSASIPGLKPTCYEKDVCTATGFQIALCFISLYLVALGAGGIQPCVSSYGADQFDDNDETEEKQKSSFFNWYYFVRNIGALVATSVVVWIQDNVGWGWGFSIPTIAVGIAVVSFFSGAKFYRNQLPGGSPLTGLCQVEELKAVLRLLPIWATGIIYSMVNSQMGNLYVLQGSTLDPRVGPFGFEIPPASLVVFNTISVLLCVPIYDRVIVHVARKLTGQQNGLTQLQRMGTGLFISIFSMVCAGVLEIIRLEIVSRNDYYELEWIPLSILWQVPQYFLVGCAEVFTVIGQLEFFYEQAPYSMRSLCTALQLTITALGSYASALLVTVVTIITTRDGSPGWITDNLNYGHLDYFFWLLAGLSVVNLGVFIVLARRHTYRKQASMPREKPSKTCR